ncbi:MAG: serine acetyltransferase [Acidobacteriaceae bacterium]|nr:serine acetyltransferase [Acidobacteriaceae bacterium]
MPCLRSIIEADLFRYSGKRDRKSLARVARTIAGAKFSVLLRVCQYLRQKQGAKIPYVIVRRFLRHYSIKYGFDISDSTIIGPGLYLGHFGGVIINPAAVLGSNINIMPGVTIGQTNRGPRKGTPRIGNRVWIGTHAVIVGNVTIGDDALIAPGAYVTFDVPASAVVVGNPGQVVSYHGTAHYICNILGDSD